MPKISIEIDITAAELSTLLRELAGKTNSKVKASRPLAYRPAIKVKTAKKPRSDMRGVRWTKQEITWLTKHLKTHSINKKLVLAFKREFGYKRSSSSLANKSYELRRK
jgi:hypothetical protein